MLAWFLNESVFITISGYGGRYRLGSALAVFDSIVRFGAQVDKTIEGEGKGKTGPDRGKSHRTGNGLH